MKENKFYPLTRESLMYLYSLGVKNSDLTILLFLKTYNPYSDPNKYQQISTKEIADELELNIRTVQKSLKKLESFNLIDSRMITFEYLVKPIQGEPDFLEKYRNYDKTNELKANQNSSGEQKFVEANYNSLGRTEIRLGELEFVEANQNSSPMAETLMVSESQNPNTSNTFNTSPNPPYLHQSERQEEEINNIEEDEIKKAIQESLDLEFDNSVLAEETLNEENNSTKTQQFLPNPTNFSTCNIINNKTENLIKDEGQKTKDEGKKEAESVNIYKETENNKPLSLVPCPLSFEECPTEFLNWKAKDWARHFGYSETKAHQNLKSCLRNKPEKISEYWQSYQEWISTEKKKKQVLIEWTVGEWVTQEEYDRRLQMRKNSPVSPMGAELINQFRQIFSRNAQRT